MRIPAGANYLGGSRIERVYQKTKLLTISGGSLEIMKDLAGNQSGHPF